MMVGDNKDNILLKLPKVTKSEKPAWVCSEISVVRDLKTKIMAVFPRKQKIVRMATSVI